MAQAASIVGDVLLVDRCTSGEESASRELFRLYQKRVHGTLFRVLGSNRDMDDLIQEAFIQIFRSLPNYRGDARLSTWIDRITVRTAYRHIKKESKREWPTDELDELSAGSPGSSQANAREGVRRLYLALAKLSPAARLAFALHEIDGRPIAEVAELVGSKHSATKLRIWRARRQLFKLAADDPYLAELLDAGSEEDSP